MYIPATSSTYLFIPVTGPADDLSGFAASIALVPEPAGAEPADGDYRTATWIDGQPALLLTAGLYPPGEYMAWVRVLASPEDVRLPSGRVRIGDTRS